MAWRKYYLSIRTLESDRSLWNLWSSLFKSFQIRIASQDESWLSSAASIGSLSWPSVDKWWTTWHWWWLLRLITVIMTNLELCKFDREGGIRIHPRHNKLVFSKIQLKSKKTQKWKLPVVWLINISTCIVSHVNTNPLHNKVDFGNWSLICFQWCPRLGDLSRPPCPPSSCLMPAQSPLT